MVRLLQECVDVVGIGSLCRDYHLMDSGCIAYPLIATIAAASTIRARRTMSRIDMVEADVKGGAAVSKPTNRYEVNTGGRNAGRRCWCDAA